MSNQSLCYLNGVITTLQRGDIIKIRLSTGAVSFKRGDENLYFGSQNKEIRLEECSEENSRIGKILSPWWLATLIAGIAIPNGDIAILQDEGEEWIAEFV